MEYTPEIIIIISRKCEEENVYYNHALHNFFLEYEHISFYFLSLKNVTHVMEIVMSQYLYFRMFKLLIFI